MINMHTCYMENGSIINGYSGGIIENPAILVARTDDVLHGWGELENVKAKFNKFAAAYARAGLTEELNDLMLIELSEYHITREMACYVMRRASEFTATGFIPKLCDQILHSTDPNAWLLEEMRRIPIVLTEKGWDAHTL